VLAETGPASEGVPKRTDEAVEALMYYI